MQVVAELCLNRVKLFAVIVVVDVVEALGPLEQCYNGCC